MNEKYYIIPNCNQYFVVVKCTEQKLNMIFEYGLKTCLTPDNAIDIHELGAWFCIHNIEHMFAIGRIRNPFLLVLIRWDIIRTKRNAKELWLDENKIIKILSLPKEERDKLFW